MPNKDNSNEIRVERLHAYSPEDAAGIGRLMPVLDSKLTDEPIPEDRLQAIIKSKYHDQFVARQEDARIVGAATLSLIMAAGTGDKGYLEDFVTNPETKGVGTVMWHEIGKWCMERNVKLNFTSNPDRTAAQHFYRSRAMIRRTTVFRAAFPQKGML